MPIESGALGRLYSLSGGGDSSGRGRITDDKSVSVATTDTAILQNNPLRIAALLVNVGANDVFVQFGAAAALNQGIPLLANGGWLLINKDFPWTGFVNGIADTLAAQLCVTEISLQTTNPEPPGGGGGGGGGQPARGC